MKKYLLLSLACTSILGLEFTASASGENSALPDCCKTGTCDVSLKDVNVCETMTDSAAKAACLQNARKAGGTGKKAK